MPAAWMRVSRHCCDKCAFGRLADFRLPALPVKSYLQITPLLIDDSVFANRHLGYLGYLGLSRLEKGSELRGSVIHIMRKRRTLKRVMATVFPSSAPYFPWLRYYVAPKAEAITVIML